MAFDPTEQRDSHGRWTRGASGEVSTALDQRVLDVSGDEWNQKTAARLEQEYALVRPELDKIAQKAVDEEVSGPASSWEDMSGSAQEEAESHFQTNSYEQEYKYEVENWYDNGEATNEAKHTLAEDADFKAEFISDFLSERDDDAEHIPYTAEQLTDALQVSAHDEGGDPDVSFSLQKLMEPDNLNPNFNPDQMALPGIDAPQPKGSDSFTADIENELKDAFIEAFNKQAEKNASDIEPPEYLKESAEESVKTQWDEMSDQHKWEWTKNNTDLIEDDEDTVTTIEMPNKFDPLNMTSGEDYRRTQALAKYISDERAAQIITLRTDAGTIGGKGWKPRSAFLGDDASYEKLYGPGGVGAKKDEAWTERMRKEMQKVDLELWTGWKGSSTNAQGMLLQVAAAEELGGRLREEQPKAPAFNKTEFALAASVYNDKMATAAQIADAEKILDKNGGAEGPLAKAYYTKFAAHTSFAEKEAAQAVIEAANPKKFYGHMSNYADSKNWAKQTISNSSGDYTPEEKAEAQKWLDANKFSVDDADKRLKSEVVGGYIRLPELNVVRNGAASTTASREVANGWGGTTNYAPSGINKKEVIANANKEYASIGGYEGVKAAIRAKWETTQYLLDRAGLPIVQVFRGINMPHTPDQAAPNTGDFNTPTSGIVKSAGGGEIHLKAMKVGESIKIESGKTITKVSDDDGIYTHSVGIGQWKYNEPPREVGRVVLRAELPRTAIVSVPAYGVNVKSEQELVVAGTAWKNWDAWSGRAPSFEDVPMHASAKSTLTKADEVEYANLMKELDAV